MPIFERCYELVDTLPTARLFKKLVGLAFICKEIVGTGTQYFLFIYMAFLIFLLIQPILFDR